MLARGMQQAADNRHHMGGTTYDRVWPITPAEQPWTRFRPIQTMERHPRGVEFDGGGPRLSVNVLAPNLLHVRLAPDGSFAPRRSWAVAVEDDAWPATPFDLRSTAAGTEMTTTALRVQVDRDPCRLACFDSEGRPFAQDAGPGLGWRAGLAPGGSAWRRASISTALASAPACWTSAGQVLTNWTLTQ